MGAEGTKLDKQDFDVSIPRELPSSNLIVEPAMWTDAGNGDQCYRETHYLTRMCTLFTEPRECNGQYLPKERVFEERRLWP